MCFDCDDDILSRMYFLAYSRLELREQVAMVDLNMEDVYTWSTGFDTCVILLCVHETNHF